MALTKITAKNNSKTDKLITPSQLQYYIFNLKSYSYNDTSSKTLVLVARWFM